MDKMTDSKAVEIVADSISNEAYEKAQPALQHIAARLREPVGVGGEWVLVPREPTPEMVATFRADTPAATWLTHTTLQCADFASRYAAMLAAAPQPAAVDGGSHD